MFKRRRKAVTHVAELNQLLAAGNSERTELINGMSESVVKGLLLYVLNDRGK